MEKMYVDSELGDVMFIKKAGVRRVSVRIHPSRGVRVTLPYFVTYSEAHAFFIANRKRVIQIVADQKERRANLPQLDKEQIEQMRNEAKSILPARLKVLAERYGLKYNKVTIKHNSTNWGSCSTKGNINLNLQLMRLPLFLVDYILIHELCHLIHHNHGEAFHALQERLCVENMLRYIDDGDEYAKSLGIAASRSRSRFPIGFTCSRSLKDYPII